MGYQKRGFDGRSVSEVRSKGHFAKAGDGNTKFFYKINNAAIHKIYGP